MIALGAAADGGLIAEARASRAIARSLRVSAEFVARESAIALLRHARSCAVYRAFVESEREAHWREVISALRAASAALDDRDAVITARALCSSGECDLALAAAAVAFEQWTQARGEG